MTSQSATLNQRGAVRPPAATSDYFLRQGLLKLLAIKDSDVRLLCRCRSSRRCSPRSTGKGQRRRDAVRGVYAALEAFRYGPRNGKPTAIICHGTKGHGALLRFPRSESRPCLSLPFTKMMPTPWDSRGASCRRLVAPTAVPAKHCSTCLIRVAPGDRAKPAHSHPKGEEVIDIIQGSGRVLVGGAVRPVRAGTAVLFPHVVHLFDSTGTEQMKFVVRAADRSGRLAHARGRGFSRPEARSPLGVGPSNRLVPERATAALDARLRSRERRAGEQSRPLHLGAPGREGDSRTRKVRAVRADSVQERCDRARRTGRVSWPCRMQLRGLELPPRVSPALCR